MQLLFSISFLLHDYMLSSGKVLNFLKMGQKVLFFLVCVIVMLLGGKYY